MFWSVTTRSVQLTLIVTLIATWSAGPAQAAPILLAEFRVSDVIVRGADLPLSTRFDFKAYEEGQFPTPVYFDWQAVYTPQNVGMTFLAPAEIVAGTNNAVRSPSATFELTMGQVSTTTWRLSDPACDADRCLQMFTSNIAQHNITSVERIIDRLVFSGSPIGTVMDGVQRIRLLGEAVPEPNTCVMLALAVYVVVFSRCFYRRWPAVM